MFAGAMTALVTPFRDGQVDEPALRALVEAQIAAGIDGLVPCGTTGEAPTLEAEEHARVVRITVEAAARRVPVIAGCGTNSTAHTIALSRAAKAAGADGLLLVTPYYNKPTQDGLFRHFTAVADASHKPVCLYNVPGRTAVNLKPAVALRLAAHPNVIGIKEASGDLHQVMELLRDRPADFSVLSGDDWLTLPLVTAGGDGLISVTSNEAPGPMTALVHLLLSGNLDRGREWHYRLMPLMDANFLETNPAPVKAALALMGRIRNVLRLPLVPVSDATCAALAAALRAVGLDGH